MSDTLRTLIEQLNDLRQRIANIEAQELLKIDATTGLPTFPALTAGSVVFAGTGGILAQDNTNLFWDDSNNRLGIGNAAPAQALHVTGTGRFSAGIRLDTLTTGSVLFSGASGALTQDNAGLFWMTRTIDLGLVLLRPP